MDEDDTPRTPLINEHVLSRQHNHWGETAMASWIRTMIITFAGVLAARKTGKMPYGIVIFALTCAWLGGVLAFTAYCMRLSARSKSKSLKDKWEQIRKTEETVQHVNAAVGALYIGLFFCLLLTYCVNMTPT